MKQVVIMPGGFHPFHAGHKALYDAALQAFPDADVYVAATNDVSQRPFPFATKQKLASYAGVDPSHFIQVKSPFRAEEITKRYGAKADDTALIFVRSDKDKDKPPRAGGIKKDGTPSYLQPLRKKLEPMTKHAYMAYLPTVRFAGGLTSATEIRQSWPNMDSAAKANLVNILYPASKENDKMTKEITRDLDHAIEGQPVDEASMKNDPEQGHIIYPDGGLGGYSPETLEQSVNRHLMNAMTHLKSGEFDKVEYMLYQWGVLESKVRALKKYLDFMRRQGRRPMAANREVDLGEDYLEEKWSEKYKRSIDCDNPRGFSQRAHCAGRQKK